MALRRSRARRGGFRVYCPTRRRHGDELRRGALASGLGAGAPAPGLVATPRISTEGAATVTDRIRIGPRREGIAKCAPTKASRGRRRRPQSGGRGRLKSDVIAGGLT